MEQNFKIIDLSDKKQIIYYDFTQLRKLKGVIIEPNPDYTASKKESESRYKTFPIVDEEWSVLNSSYFEIVAHEGDTVPCTADFFYDILDNQEDDALNSNHNLEPSSIYDLFQEASELGLKVQDTDDEGKHLCSIIDLSIEFIDSPDGPEVLIAGYKNYSQFFFPSLFYREKRVKDIANNVALYVYEYGRFFHRDDLRVKIHGLEFPQARKSFQNIEQLVNESIIKMFEKNF